MFANCFIEEEAHEEGIGDGYIDCENHEIEEDFSYLIEEAISIDLLMNDSNIFYVLLIMQSIFVVMKLQVVMKSILKEILKVLKFLPRGKV